MAGISIDILEQSEAVARHFNSINDYDTCSQHVVPDNETIQETVYKISLDYLSYEDNKMKAVDLGLGTAHGASLFLLNNENALLTGIDFSSKMLDKAKRNLSANDLLARTKIVNQDFTKEMNYKDVDIVFSTIAIHNATDEGKQKLFRNIFRMLKPGGLFVNGDFVHSESDSGQRSWERYYREYMKRYLSGGELEAWMRHAFVEDKPARLSDQQEWLYSAGFSEFGVISEGRRETPNFSLGSEAVGDFLSIHNQSSIIFSFWSAQ
ncbi:MAG: class I SAM-dependent methyltransferase [Candidatus Micrarchaeota archaeon]|nr:class I SAM-dependent methyltransferase [Candidatus Micrarchaeota archaeon]